MAPGTNLGAATPVSMVGETPLPGPATRLRRSGDDRPAGADGARRADRDGEPRSPTTRRPTSAGSRRCAGATPTGPSERCARRSSLPLRRRPRSSTSSSWSRATFPTCSPRPTAAPWSCKAGPCGSRPRGLDIVARRAGLARPAARGDADRSRTIGYLLLLVGIYGLHLRVLATRARSLPGVLGAICLLLGAATRLQICCRSTTPGLALALLGIGLMIAEAFVPAFGALGLGGVGAFVDRVGDAVRRRHAGLPSAAAGGRAGAALVSAAFFGGGAGTLMRARRRPVVSGNAAMVGDGGAYDRWTGREGEVAGPRRALARARRARPLEPGLARQRCVRAKASRCRSSRM